MIEQFEFFALHFPPSARSTFNTRDQFQFRQIVSRLLTKYCLLLLIQLMTREQIIKIWSSVHFCLFSRSLCVPGCVRMTNLCRLDQQRAAAACQLRFVTTATQMFVHIKTDNKLVKTRKTNASKYGVVLCAYLAIKATDKAPRGCEAKTSNPVLSQRNFLLITLPHSYTNTSRLKCHSKWF
jgi:hypothetical protein